MANDPMVDRLVCEGALWSQRLIAAFRATPRQCFLDRVFRFHRKSNQWREVITRQPGPRELEIIYADRALITHVTAADGPVPQTPISSSSQPSLMAQMLEDLHLAPGLSVLEVGAGTGYNAALLAYMVGPGRVVSLDIDRNVLSEAWDHLRGFPESRVELRQGDGREGWPEAAPYDRIMVTAACAGLEPAWLGQLKDAGMLLAPCNLAPGLSFLVRGTSRNGRFEGHLTRPAYFLPLRGEPQPLGTVETGDAALELDFGSFPGTFQQRPAPWAGWFERRTARLRWFGFIQALAFYGWLRGLTIHVQSANGQPCYGVSENESVCWFAGQEWRFNDGAAYELGWKLWRNFLDAGGPWPNEFRWQASPDGGLHPVAPESYLRQGPRCQYLFELIGQRERTFSP
jgi:protein-L-isoaspartate(D-aspartate) O-methyltransferase